MKTTKLSEQSQTVLLLIRHLEMKGEKVTTEVLTKLRGTRTGPTNRILQRLKRKGLVDLVLDPDGNKAAREWRLSKKEMTNGTEPNS